MGFPFAHQIILLGLCVLLVRSNDIGVNEEKISTAVFSESPTTDLSTQQETTTEWSGETTVLPTTKEVKNRMDSVESTTMTPFSNYVYEVDHPDGNLQDESKIFHNLFLSFESKRYEPSKAPEVKEPASEPSIQVTSFLADSETAVPMDPNEMIARVSNKSQGGEHMISAFLIAPEDEVNEIDRTKYSGRPIVVTNLNEDLVRTERYSEKGTTKKLTNDILAPIRAAVSLSQEAEEPVMSIEKQELREEPVYKTYIEIQKSIPYEIKEEEQKETRPINNDISLPPVHQKPIVKSPLYYPPSIPMYYLPQSYIGNYIMRHSHENADYRHIRPVLPLQYYLRYQPQLYSGLVLTHPYYLDNTANNGETLGQEADQNVLQTDPRAQYQHLHYQSAPPAPTHQLPFRPSSPVFTSQYPPFTYRVLSTMRGRGGHARTARSKQLCIEYGGFKPPMVPSVQIDEAQLAEPHEKPEEGTV